MIAWEWLILCWYQATYTIWAWISTHTRKLAIKVYQGSVKRTQESEMVSTGKNQDNFGIKSNWLIETYHICSVLCIHNVTTKIHPYCQPLCNAREQLVHYFKNGWRRRIKLLSCLFWILPSQSNGWHGKVCFFRNIWANN